MLLGGHTKDKGIIPAEYRPASQQGRELAHSREGRLRGRGQHLCASGLRTYAGFSFTVHELLEQNHLSPLDIDLPVNKVESWLIHGRCFNSLYDTSLYTIKIK